jgi:acyltransferase
MNRTISIIKALGIIAVVSGHVGGDLGGIFYLYHMPLFFLISGYLYNDKYSNQLLVFLTKKLKSLYLPYLIISISFILLRNFFIKIGIYGTDPTLPNPVSYISTTQNIIINIQNAIIFKYEEPLLVALWFVVCLFNVSMLFAIIRYISLKINTINNLKTTFFIVVVCFFFGFYLVRINYRLPIQLDNALIALFFYYLGYIYRQYETKITFQGIFALLAFLALKQLRTYGSINMHLQQFVDPSFYVLCGVIGIYANFWLGRKISNYNNIIAKSLVLIGENTFPILVLHLLALKIVTWALILVDPNNTFALAYVFPQGALKLSFGMRLIYSLIGVVVPVLFWLLLKRTLNFTSKVSLTSLSKKSPHL